MTTKAATVACPLCGRPHAVQTSLLEIAYLTCPTRPGLPVLVVRRGMVGRVAAMVARMAAARWN